MLSMSPGARRFSRRAAWAAAALLWIGARPAQAEEPVDGLRLPERLTVGASSADQFLGQLTPDGKRLALVSNRNIANEVLWLDMASGSMRAAFDEGAESTWPRVSPDGRHLLYVSFRDRASGQLCVREVPEGGDRRCLDEPGGAIFGEWISPSSIALVTRASGSVHGDLRLLKVAVTPQKPLSAGPLLERNVAGLAVSPDGRWLVYVPVQRYSERVGPNFAARVGARLEAVRLDQPEKTWPLALDLPGLSAQPAFSRDGRFLYVTQFLDDTSRDGAIDGADNGVLFRVPWQGELADAPERAAAAFPEQLTDGRRSCQYPAPAPSGLVATCARRDGLDVFMLPLEGEVPPAWTTQRLWEEVDHASRGEDRLLLYRHILGREREARPRRRALVRLALLHLELDQFAAAEFYAGQLSALVDPANPGLSRPLSILVAHRKARRGRSQAGSDFAEKARARLAELAPRPEEKRGAVALGHIVRSEIAEDLGELDLARAELDAVHPEEQTSQVVFHVLYLRADAFYRLVDDREGLAALLRKLARHASLEKEERLHYARALIHALGRGLPAGEAEAALERERAQLDPEREPESELGFALDLGQAVLAIRDDNPSKQVRQALVDLYRRQARRDRQRAVVLEAVQRAAALDAEKVIEALSAIYLADVPSGSMERRAAVRLYQRAAEGRAYRRLAAGRTDRAIERFEECAAATGSHESLIEALALRLQSGAAPAAPAEVLAAVDKKIAQRPDAKALRTLAEVFLIAHALPALDGEAHAKGVEKAVALLRGSWSELRKDGVARALYGVVQHQSFLRTGDAAQAQRASSHYLVALERARSSPRHLALILGQLGMLHEQVGNWRIALGFLDEREKLPYLNDATTLAVRLSRARVLLHAEREAEAAKVAEAALAMAEATPALAGYRPLALDRAALYNLAAGSFERASALYDREVELLEARPGGAGARNRITVRLARAAAALGAGKPQRALDDLAEVDRGLADRAVGAELRWANSTKEQVLRGYRLIASGLRANAQAQLGQVEQAERSLQERRRLYAEQLAESGRAEDAHALSLVEARLASAARARGAGEESARWLAAALESADGALVRSGAAVDAEELAVLWLAADVEATTRAKLAFDLPKRLRGALKAIQARGDGRLRGYEGWLEAYLGIVEAGAPAGAGDGGSKAGSGAP